MNKIVFIATGGALGAILRYLVSGITYKYLDSSFPWGTLAVNLIGCFIIGFLWSLSERYPFPTSVTQFIFVGVLGAFTTFSTYGLESINLLRDGEIMFGLANILGSNALGLVAVLIGLFCARLFVYLFAY